MKCRANSPLRTAITTCAVLGMAFDIGRCVRPSAQPPPAVAAGRARLGRHPGLLGPAAAAGAAGPVARHADPLHHRGRLSAVQLFRPGRQSGRLQCRSGADDLRGAENRLHRPDAAVRYAVAVACRQPRRCGDGLDRGHAGGAQARRFQRSVLPHAGPLRGAPRRRACDDVRPEQLEGKKVAVVAGTAHEAFLKALFTEAELRPYRHAGAGARRAAQGRGRSAVRRRHLARVLAQRHRLGRTAAPFAAGRSSRAATSAKASASR